MSRAGTVKIEWDASALRKLQGAALKALELTAYDVLTDIRGSQVVPKDTGALENSGFVDLVDIMRGIASIVFDTPYARRLYWHPEYNFRTDKNPYAQGRWMDMYLKGGAKEGFVQVTFAKHFRACAGGLLT